MIAKGTVSFDPPMGIVQRSLILDNPEGWGRSSGPAGSTAHPGRWHVCSPLHAAFCTQTLTAAASGHAQGFLCGNLPLPRLPGSPGELALPETCHSPALTSCSGLPGPRLTWNVDQSFVDIQEGCLSLFASFTQCINLKGKEGKDKELKICQEEI